MADRGTRATDDDIGAPARPARRNVFRIGLNVGMALAVLALSGRWAPAGAAPPFTLIMVDDPGCSYCRKFEAEIGPGYPRTPHGRIAPLLKIRRGSPELQAFGTTNYTPTFILVRGQREVGRITGYPGAEYFYEELASLLDIASQSWRQPQTEDRSPGRT
jgi:hypothetical protein